MGAVNEMMDEEPEINLTPMIDVVFLLLIFFMCMKFKMYEKKLPSELPLDQGLFQSPPTPLQQLRFTIQLLPGEVEKVMIVPDPNYNPFHLVKWKEGKEGKKQMFREIEAMIINGWKMIGDKIEIAPNPNVPFDFVALTLNAVNKAKEKKEGDLLKRLRKMDDRDPMRAGLEKKVKKVTFKAAPPEGRPE